MKKNSKLLFVFILFVLTTFGADVCFGEIELGNADYKLSEKGIVLKAFSKNGKYFTDVSDRPKREIASNFIKSNLGNFGLTQNVSELEFSHENKFNNLRKITHKQFHNGFEVLGSEIVTFIDDKGRVIGFTNDYKGQVGEISLVPVLPKDICIDKAVKSVKGSSDVGKSRADLAIFKNNLTHVLVWKIIIKNNMNEYIVLVDSTSGMILKSKSLRII